MQTCQPIIESTAPIRADLAPVEGLMPQLILLFASFAATFLGEQ